MGWKKIDTEKKIDGFWKRDSGAMLGIIEALVGNPKEKDGNAFLVVRAYKDSQKAMFTTKDDAGNESAPSLVKADMRIGVSLTAQMKSSADFGSLIGYGLRIEFKGQKKLDNGRPMNDFDLEVTDGPFDPKRDDMPF